MEVILKIRNLESFLKSIAAAEDYFNNTDGAVALLITALKNLV